MADFMDEDELDDDDRDAAFVSTMLSAATFMNLDAELRRNENTECG